MKVAVMTTGPGVIRPIATASMNWRSVSQWCWWTTPSRRNGTMARPLPNMKAPALAKNKNSATRVPPPAAKWTTVAGQLVGGDGDDGHDRGGDAVKQGLHDRQAL